MYAVVRGWAIPPYKVGRRFGPGTPHDADMVKIKTAGEAAWLEAAWLRLGLTGIKQLSSQPGFGITTTITTVEFRPCLAKPIVPSHFRQTLMQIIGISHHHMLDVFAAFISYPLNWTFLATTNHHKTRGIPLLGASIFLFFLHLLASLKGVRTRRSYSQTRAGTVGKSPQHHPPFTPRPGIGSRRAVYTSLIRHWQGPPQNSFMRLYTQL